jgi:hypothetical protein
VSSHKTNLINFTDPKRHLAQRAKDDRPFRPRNREMRAYCVSPDLLSSANHCWIDWM